MIVLHGISNIPSVFKLGAYLSKFKRVYCCLIPGATLSCPLLRTAPPLSHSGPEKWVPPDSMVWRRCHHRERMRDCLIISHVSDSCGRKAATGDKRLPALSSSHQVGPVGYHAIVLTLLPVQPLLYLARALPTHLLHRHSVWLPMLLSHSSCIAASVGLKSNDKHTSR